MARPRLVSQLTPGRPIRIPRTRRCPYRCSRAARSWWWRTRRGCCGRRRRPSPGSSTSRTSASPCRSPPSRSTATRRPAARSHVRLSPAGREVQRQCAALRLVRARPATAGHQRSVPAAQWAMSPTCRRPAANASSNDVTTDDRGLLYLLDRQRGLDIIESPSTDLTMTYLQQALATRIPTCCSIRRCGRATTLLRGRWQDENGVMLEGTIEQLTRATIEAMRRALRAADCDLADVVGHRLPGRRARFWPLQRRVQGVLPGRICSRARPWRPARSSTPRSRSSASPQAAAVLNGRANHISRRIIMLEVLGRATSGNVQQCCSCSKSWARRTSATITARPSRAPRSPRNTRPSTPRRRCRPATASCTWESHTILRHMWPTSRKPTRCIRAIPPRAARSSAGWTGRWPRSTWPTWPASRKPSCRPSN